jgi:RHS repeat-associated protein
VAFVGKDLQGGVDILQTASYYPFGLVMNKSEFGLPASLQNRYLYNGKELNPDKMTSEALEWYDYGARMYDPQIGRFHSIDPLMEWHFNYTPYHYTATIPKIRDPFGQDTESLM